MEHSAVVSKNTSTTVFARTEESTPSISIHKLSNTLTFTDITSSPSIVSLGNQYWKCQITTPDEDCYLCIKFGTYPIVIRVGSPVLRFLYYAIEENRTIPFKHISSTSGTVLSSGTLTNLGNGFYYTTPSTTDLSIIEVEDVPNLLKIPYSLEPSDPPTPGTGLGVPYNFFDTGYNMFAFPGGEYTRFDISTGKWIAHTEVTKVSDLAKAVAYRYGLEWIDTSQLNWIGNYISYMRSYDEEGKKFRNYVPSVTPEANVNNFALQVRDEMGQLSLRGITMLTIQDLETIPEGSGGLVMDFTSE